MISDHIKRNTVYTFVYNLSDAASVHAALHHLQLRPECSRLINSLTAGMCIFRQTQASWSNAMLCKTDYVEPSRNIGQVKYDTHPFIPSISQEQTDQIIRELYRLADREKAENKDKSKGKESDIDKLSLKLLELWIKNPYTPIVRLFDKIGKLPFESQLKIREYLQNDLASFEETRIGRSNYLLMEPTFKAYQVLGLPLPEGHQGRGGISHRHFAWWIYFHQESLGYAPCLEWLVPGTKHPTDVGVNKEGNWEAYEVCVTATDNLSSHIEATEHEAPIIPSLLDV